MCNCDARSSAFRIFSSKLHQVCEKVVSIADDKAGEGEEEVNGQIAVVQRMGGTKAEMGLTQMIDQDEHRSHAAQSVEYLAAIPLQFWLSWVSIQAGLQVNSACFGVQYRLD